MPQLELPVSDNLMPTNSPAGSEHKAATFAMTVAAIVLMVAYFAISVLAIAR